MSQQRHSVREIARVTGMSRAAVRQTLSARARATESHLPSLRYRRVVAWNATGSHHDMAGAAKAWLAGGQHLALRVLRLVVI